MSSLQEELDGYSDYWKTKILNNIQRDKENEADLEGLGWTVLRFWGSEVNQDLDACVATVQEAIRNAKTRT